MTQKNPYYENLAQRIHDIVLNEKYMKLLSGYAVVKEKEKEHTYSLQPFYNLTPEKQKDNRNNIDEFIRDFKNHLINDAPFKIVNKGYDELHAHLIGMGASFFFDSAERHATSYVEPIVPTLEQFEKVIRCFEGIISSIGPLIRGLPYGNNKDNLNHFLPVIMSLHNSYMYANETQYSLGATIGEEIRSLVGHFRDSKEPFVREGISHYLNNKKLFLDEVKDRGFELEILHTLKHTLHSDYWTEVASQLPTLNVKKEKNHSSGNFSSLDSTPIYRINLDKDGILNAFSKVVTDEDFEEMMGVVGKSINMHKPNIIDFIQVVGASDKIIVSGKGVSQDLAVSIGTLFEKMIDKYNSNDVCLRATLTEDEKKANQDYLNKVAETYWLELSLNSADKNKQSGKKRNKI